MPDTVAMHSSRTTAFSGHRRPVVLLVAVILLGLLARIGVLIVRFDELSIDRDAYLAIAGNLVDGHGFCSVPGHPTAFRPPLYPLLVAACLACGGFWLVGAVQVALGTLTVAGTAWLSRAHGLSERASLVAAFCMAFDPLMLAYTPQAMTETLFTFLVLALLLSIESLPRISPGGATRDGSTSPARIGFLPHRWWFRPALIGTLFGLAALCRPTVWAFALLLAALKLAGWLLRVRHAATIKHLFVWTRDPRQLAVVGVMTILFVAPWVIRNCVVLGRPILMTTHGGYTLLLGNNDVFFDEVVSQTADTTWQAASLERWQHDVEQRARARGVDWSDELARDAALKQEAQLWIRQSPDRFLQCAWLRLQRLWALTPAEPAGLSPTGIYVIGGWYALVFGFAVFGGWCRWSLFKVRVAGPVFVLSLTLLHLAYWANTRMRAPAMPVVAVFVAAAFGSVQNNRKVVPPVME